MHCCTPVTLPSLGGSLRTHVSHWSFALALIALVGGLTSWPTPAQAQMLPTAGAARNFPEAALRGTLVVTGQGVAEINGQAIRMAPGMRLLNPENALVMLHTVVGQKFTVNYLVEQSTGMLLTAWVLSAAEAAQERKGSGVQRNYRFESDSTTVR
ncbi:MULTISPECIES: hypothetical protein [Giesbergeria]|uniref:Pilus formation protein N-terminal domain-containing protein n=1 Tax=Giesbergeria sinuosa TaxID=80883 RepID=A0ABV9Q8R1_9BURK